MIIIAGPCVLEPGGMALEVGTECQKICLDLGIRYIFKSSWDKANRTSAGSYRGPGLTEGLRELWDIKTRLGCEITTDVHETVHVGLVGKIADVIQIPAFLCRQTDLLAAAAETGRIVSVKKGQFLAPEAVAGIAEKLPGVEFWAIERGTTFGYGGLVVDMTSFLRMRPFAKCIIFDATHSVQIPNSGRTTGGSRDFIPVLARAAVAAGADGVFMEVHPDPEKARCDAGCQLPLERFGEVVRSLKALEEAL